MNRHMRRAAALLAATAVVDAILGVVFGYADRIGPFHGVYCATGIATTVGCDVPLVTRTAYWLSLAMMLTVVPLFAAVFSLVTTGLTAGHIDERHAALKEHVSDAAAGCNSRHEAT